MAEHTPGPWHPRYGGEPGYVYSSSASKVVCIVPHEQSDAVDNPDSRLITAAPDLLAACEALSKAPLDPSGRWTDEEKQALKLLRAAIAKAKGQS